MNEESSFWKTITSQSEVIRLKGEIEQLKSASQAEKDAWVQERIALRKEIEQLQKDVRNEQEKVLAAKREIKTKEDKYEACNEQLNFARSEFFAEKEIFGKKVLELEKQNQKLRAAETELIGKMDGLRREQRNDSIERENVMRTLRCDIEMHVKEKEVLMKQLEAVHNNWKDVNKIEVKLNCALEEKKNLEEELKKLNESKRLSDLFHDELKELGSFRAQNEELREQNESLRKSALSVDELMEKVDVMEKEIHNLKSENEKVAIFKSDLNTLRNEIKDWQLVTGVANPSAACEKISRFIETEKRLITELDGLKSKYNELSRFNLEKKVECVFIEKTLNNDVNKIGELEEQMKKLEEKCTVISKERDDYKKVIDACERMTTTRSDISIEERIELQSVISKYRLLTSTPYIAESDENTDEPSRKRLRSDEESTNCKNIEFESLQKRLLEQTELNKNILAENSTLRSQLQQVENTVNSEVKSSDNEVEKLKQQLMTTEKKQHHILEAFKKTSKEFREVVCILTGYKIDVLKQKGYRLSHIYAENTLTDVLQFELEVGGTMKLLSNEYSERISPLIDTYVKKHNSFPAFLASVTMDLFKRRPQSAIEKPTLSVKQV